jgi:hypothetical protein
MNKKPRLITRISDGADRPNVGGLSVWPFGSVLSLSTISNGRRKDRDGGFNDSVELEIEGGICPLSDRAEGLQPGLSDRFSRVSLATFWRAEITVLDFNGKQRCRQTVLTSLPFRCAGGGGEARV